MQTIKPKLFVFIILFFALIVTPAILNQYYNFLLAPVSKSKDSKPIIVVIKQGEPFQEVAKNLYDQGLIKNVFAFRLLVAQMGISKSIQAGDFKLNQSMSAREIAQELTHGAIDVWVTLPEGLRIEEQADIISAKLQFGQNNNYNFDKKEYVKVASEGYMFPDTYLIPKDANTQNVTSRLKQTFVEKVPTDILNNGAENNLTPKEVIILASIIERESRGDKEKATIAGILLNRLKIGMALQVDSTVQYAKGYNSADSKWWPQISTEDYRSVKSPYNTYLNPGLPPGPICNPGLASIKAAAFPQDTPYLYYLHDSKGQIHYAKTADEHNQNIKDFL